MARARAATQHLSHVSFQPTAIADIVLDEPVDAVIGRLILMHLTRPGVGTAPTASAKPQPDPAGHQHLVSPPNHVLHHLIRV